MTLEEAKYCFQRDMCLGCKYHDSDISCLEKAQEIAVTAIEYLMVGQKLAGEAENK